jgi:hypothetical protein
VAARTTTPGTWPWICGETSTSLAKEKNFDQLVALMEKR